MDTNADKIKNVWRKRLSQQNYVKCYVNYLQFHCFYHSSSMVPWLTSATLLYNAGSVCSRLSHTRNSPSFSFSYLSPHAFFKFCCFFLKIHLCGLVQSDDVSDDELLVNNSCTHRPDWLPVITLYFYVYTLPGIIICNGMGWLLVDIFLL